MSNFNEKFLHAYFICGSQDVPEGKTLLGLVEEALKAGITAFQFRDKGPNSTLSESERLPMAKKLQQLCQQYHVPFVIDDDIQLAQKIHADGIHVGQKDEGIKQVVQDVDGKMFIGYSCSNLTEIEHANKVSGIDYYGGGPVFATPSKNDAEPEFGVAGLADIVKRSLRPVVAIGGIRVDDLPAIASTKAAGVSAISMIAQSNHIDQTVKAMLDAPWINNK